MVSVWLVMLVALSSSCSPNSPSFGSLIETPQMSLAQQDGGKVKINTGSMLSVAREIACVNLDVEMEDALFLFFFFQVNLLLVWVLSGEGM